MGRDRPIGRMHITRGPAVCKRWRYWDSNLQERVGQTAVAGEGWILALAQILHCEGMAPQIFPALIAAMKAAQARRLTMWMPVFGLFESRTPTSPPGRGATCTHWLPLVL